MTLLHTAHVPAGEGPFPTLIALHGWGASAHDLLGLAPIIDGGRALMLCPQGDVEVPVAPGMNGYGWFPLQPGQPPDPEAFRRGVERAREFVETAVGHYPVDPDRLAVLGFSQGGAVAYALALGEPRRFSGVAALSSWLADPVADALPPTPEHAGLPVLVVHGTRDSMLPIERARSSRDRLRDYRVNLMYREFDMAHEINRDALALVGRWLEEKAWSGAERTAGGGDGDGG